MSTIVRVERINKSYLDGANRRQVLSDLDFELVAGGVLALTGPSGSGKSTLLNILAGTVAVDSGRVVISDGSGLLDLTTLSARQATQLRRQHIGYVFQSFNLVPTLTVRENVLLPLELNRRGDLAKTALARLDAMGMAARMDDFPAHLSAGERQRTAIARALAHEPVLVLADEPTGSLDVDNAEVVARMLISHVRKLGSALVLATHDGAVAARADQVIRLGS